MTPERWSAVERLYHAALERDTGERAAFLLSACAGDEELRREVESLLEYEPKAEAFLEPAGSNGAERAGSLATAVPVAQMAATPGRLAGRTFGSYKVQALVAAGGMGEVYRAVDARLNRTVAIKVLPEHLSDHPERRERFRREALLISSLNHPHICALYHVGTDADLDYLVMEYIDGETLQDRLKRGRMHWTEALDRLIEIADALANAHRQRIVHRDLKPANVMLTKAGAKVLDFGLAARRGPLDGSALDPALAGSQELTVEGRIMGTVPYMAPEQLQGKPTDARTDVFAFGAVAYEMLTGKPAFSADSQADLIGAILKDDPQPIAASAADVPIVLARAIARCLAKDPHERWQTAADLLFQLRSIAESAGTPVQDSTRRRSSHRTERVLWLAAVAASLCLGVFQWRSRDSQDAPPAAAAGTVRFPLLPPRGTTFPSSFDVPFALSPDGRRIAFVAVRDDGTRHLWLRSLDSGQEVLLAGTEGATSPFWKPDSEWVAFFAAGTLKKVRVTSPVAQEIAATSWTMGGAAWSRNDVIVFPGQGGLHRVSADGGPVSRVGNDKTLHLWPQFLDDGQHYLYSSFTPRSLLLGSLAGEPPRVLMTFPVNVSALAYVSGTILFVEDGVLFARPFDERRGEFTGDARRIVEGIPVTGPGRAPFSVAAGVLAFWPNASGAPALLKWFTRNGESSPALDAPAKYFGFSLSPDGRRLAFSRVGSNGGPDLWVRNLDTGGETQLTFDGAAYTPQWSPDGSQILFTGIIERPPPRLFIRDATRPGAARPLDAGPGPQFAASWSGSDLLSVIAGMGQPGGYELMVQRVEGGHPETLALDTAADETEGSLSSNGKWIAYTSDQTGRDEVWVAGLPSAKLRRQVSLGGGHSPRWCDGENALVYLASDKRLTAVSFRGSAERIDLGDRQPLFAIRDLIQFDRRLTPTANYYAATVDCRRFLVATTPPDPQVPPINIVLNWPAVPGR